MRSKAQFKSHPLHPMLVAFPIAFFIGTLVFDVLAAVYNSTGFGITAFYLEISGIAGGLLAAVPGIIDYMYTVPPKSSASKRGATHGMLNGGIIILFTAVWFYRQGNDPSQLLIIALEATGVVLLGISGFMGGTLVYRNQIGVDPRYAHAGKWKELYLDDHKGSVAVADENELKVNQMKLIHINDKRIVLGRTEKGYVAFDDYCTHKGGSLAGGAMICGTVQCPWHGSQFSVTSGEVTAGPALTKIPTYEVNIVAGKVILVLG